MYRQTPGARSDNIFVRSGRIDLWPRRTGGNSIAWLPTTVGTDHVLVATPFFWRSHRLSSTSAPLDAGNPLGNTIIRVSIHGLPKAARPGPGGVRFRPSPTLQGFGRQRYDQGVFFVCLRAGVGSYYRVPDDAEPGIGTAATSALVRAVESPGPCRCIGA